MPFVKLSAMPGTNGLQLIVTLAGISALVAEWLRSRRKRREQPRLQLFLLVVGITALVAQAVLAQLDRREQGATLQRIEQGVESLVAAGRLTRDEARGLLLIPEPPAGLRIE
jgi:hypothetical protein